MNYKCLTADLGFAAGTIISASSIDEGTAKNYLNWGLLAKTDEAPASEVIQEPTAQEIAAGLTKEVELTDEELARLTDPDTKDDANN